MGMLGALAGFGQGLQDYSKVMLKKQEQDWLDQQARVKYEREQNLETLRLQNQRALQTERLTFEEGWNKKKLESEDTRFQATKDYQTKVLEGQQAESAANAEYRAAMLKGQQEQTQYARGAEDRAFSVQKRLYEFQQTKSEEEANKMLRDLEGSPLWDSLSSQEKALMQLSAKNPKAAVAASSIMKRDDLVKFDGKDIVELTKLASEEFENLRTDEDRQTDFANMKRKLGAKSDEEALGLYTNWRIDQAKQAGQRKKVDTTKPQQEAGNKYLQFKHPDDIDKDEELYIRGQLDPKLFESLSPFMKARFKRAKESTQDGNDPSWMYND